MIEQLETAVKAATDLLAIPQDRWRDGESSAEWYRRAMGREKAMRAAEDALRLAHGAVCAARSSCCAEIDEARAAVVEDAARGGIQ
jgi:hypothetical protein